MKSKQKLILLYCIKNEGGVSFRQRTIKCLHPKLLHKYKIPEFILFLARTHWLIFTRGDSEEESTRGGSREARKEGVNINQGAQNQSKGGGCC